MLLAFPTGSAMPVPVSCCTHYSQQSQHPKAEEGHQDSFHPMAGGKRWSTIRFGSLGCMAGQLLLKHSVKHLGSGKRQHQQISLANSLPPANRGIKIQQQTSALPFVVQCMNSLSAGDRDWESLVVVQGATLGNRRKSEEAKKRKKNPKKTTNQQVMIKESWRGTVRAPEHHLAWWYPDCAKGALLGFGEDWNYISPTV